MFVLDDDGALPARWREGAAAIGNFDGVHLGHQAVIRHARQLAARHGRPTIVISFDPHPARFFRPSLPPFALDCRAQKLRQLEALGVDAVAIIPFTPALAALNPEEFARLWLVERLGIAHAVTGADFTFGQGRAGRVADLARLGQQLGFDATTVEAVRDEHGVISSTRIRHAIARGETGMARAMLSRPFAICAPVIHGDQRGRTIGIPTINQLLGDYVRPRYGVYATSVRLPDGETHMGVANLGIRPMFDPPRELLETWIPGWSGDLYGADVEVSLLAWLRPEIRFASLAQLRAQIDLDVAAARLCTAKKAGDN